MATVKETLELLDGLKVLAVTGGDIFADGKINLADLPKLKTLATNYGTLKEAVVGIQDVDDELKDLDSEEIAQIIAKVAEIVAAVKAELAEG